MSLAECAHLLAQDRNRLALRVDANGQRGRLCRDALRQDRQGVTDNRSRVGSRIGNREGIGCGRTDRAECTDPIRHQGEHEMKFGSRKGNAHWSHIARCWRRRGQRACRGPQIVFGTSCEPANLPGNRIPFPGGERNLATGLHSPNSRHCYIGIHHQTQDIPDVAGCITVGALERVRACERIDGRASGNCQSIHVLKTKHQTGHGQPGDRITQGIMRRGQVRQADVRDA